MPWKLGTAACRNAFTRNALPQYPLPLLLYLLVLPRLLKFATAVPYVVKSGTTISALLTENSRTGEGPLQSEGDGGNGAQHCDLLRSSHVRGEIEAEALEQA